LAKRIYITHCSCGKDDALKGTDTKVSPDKLYTSTPIQRFMDRCKDERVDWAVLSDEYGVWFPGVRHKWYDTPPGKVTEEEFTALVEDFERKLLDYGEVWFYHNPGRFHRLYRRLIETVNAGQAMNHRIRLFSCVYEIV